MVPLWLSTIIFDTLKKPALNPSFDGHKLASRTHARTRTHKLSSSM